jgi:hypothetical protein
MEALIPTFGHLFVHILLVLLLALLFIGHFPTPFVVSGGNQQAQKVFRALPASAARSANGGPLYSSYKT